MSSNNQPIFKRKLGLLDCAVFPSRNAGSSLRSISLSRSYYDKESADWKTTRINLGESDVSAVIKLLNAAEEHLLSSASAPRQRSQEDADQMVAAE